MKTGLVELQKQLRRFLKRLPLRQQIVLGAAIGGGLLLLLSGGLNLFAPDTLNLLIVVYAIMIPLALLTTDCLMDMNDPRVFRIWLTLALIMLIVSLVTHQEPAYFIRTSNEFERSLGMDKPAGHYSTSSLRALVVLLLCCWVINKLIYKKGRFLINTFRQGGWYHDSAKRRITWVDVLLNMLLYAILAVSWLQL